MIREKRLKNFSLFVFFILILSLSFVSAGFFDWFKKEVQLAPTFTCTDTDGGENSSVKGITEACSSEEILKMTGVGDSYETFLRTKNSFSRNLNPSFRVNFKVEEMNATSEPWLILAADGNGPKGTNDLRRHEILVRDNSIDFYWANGLKQQISPLMPYIKGNWYSFEMDIDGNGSKIFVYPMNGEKPLTPSHSVFFTDWDPYFAFWIYKDVAYLDSIQIISGGDNIIDAESTIFSGGWTYGVKENLELVDEKLCETRTDSCINSEVLEEFFCKVDDLGVEGNTITCENGCSNGACLYPSSTVNCTDGDGGLNYYVSSEVIYTDELGQHILSDGCKPENTKIVYESICNENGFGQSIEFECSVGCQEGACVGNPGNVTNITCVDSDGGLNYFTYGEAKGINENGIYTGGDFDVCTGDGENILAEKYCEDNIVKNTYFACPVGCFEGVCVGEEPIQFPPCGAILDRIQNHSDFSLDGIDYISYGDRWRDSYFRFIDGVQENYTSYGGGWDVEESFNHVGNLFYTVKVFDNENLSLSLNQDILRSPACSARTFWDFSGAENKIVLCDWNALYKSKDIFQYQNVWGITWIKDNLEFTLESHLNNPLTTSEIEQRIQQNLGEFIASLKGGYTQGIYFSELSSLPLFVNEVLKNDLASCPSDIDSSLCEAHWYCEINPLICPDHGEQKITCDSFNCGNSVDVRWDCEPGICSGCLLGSKFEEKCIPYGFRAESGDVSKRIFLKEEGSAVISLGDSKVYEILVDFIDEEGVILNVNGEVTDLLMQSDSVEISGINLTVKSIDFSSVSGEDSAVYLVAVLSSESPLYCDYDGDLKVQKSKTADGSWEKCQNNYECLSNICSNGECVDVIGSLETVKSEVGFFKRLSCRVASIVTLGIVDYEECVLGNVDSVSSGGNASFGGGGGSGGSSS